MPFAGLPEGAQILPAGLPEGAKVLTADQNTDPQTGTPIIDVPGGEMTTAEKLNNPYFDIKTAEQLREEMKKNVQPVIDEMGPVGKTVTGIGAGMYDVAKGVQQAGAELGNKVGLVSNDTLSRITREGQEARDVFAPLKNQSTAAMVGDIVGRIAPWLAVPAGAPEGALARILVGAGTGAGMGALEFTPEDGSRVENAVKGAALGGAGAGVLAGVSKAYNAAATNPLAEITTQKLSDRFKIPVTLSELTGKANRTDTLMERVPGPFGIKGFREAQQQAAKNAATEHFAQYTIDPALDSTAAMKVANDAHLDELYNVVRQNAESIPQAAAPEVKQAAMEMLDRYPGVFDAIQDTHLKKILQNIVLDTKDRVVQVPGAPAPALNIGNVHAVPDSASTTAAKFSFDDLWALRKGIGKEIGDASTGTAKGQLSAIYAAVSNDMDAMLAGHSDEAVKAFREANDAFKQYSLKFDVLRQAYDKAMGTTGAGTAGFFSPQKYGTALKNLANDPTYKKNVKWSPGEIEEMTGLANILQVTKRAGQFMENPPTGNRWGLPSIAGAAGGGSYLAGGLAATAKTAGTGALAALVTKFITTTPAGKRLALAASKAEPTSPTMTFIMNQVYNQLPKLAVSAGAGE